MKSVYIDIDDVIANTSKSIPVLAEKLFGIKVQYEDLTSFNFNESLKLNPAQLETFFEYLHREEVLIEFFPVKGAKESLNKIKELGYVIYIITGRPPHSFEITKKWLQKNGFIYDYLYFADKYSRYSDTNKPHIISMDQLAEIDFTLIIEDSLKMAMWFNEKKSRVALIDHPWNREYDAAKSVFKRCFNWNDVMGYL